jgi:hypothetical protein
VRRQAELLEIVRALGTPGRFSGGLNRRKEESDEDADDRDDHQQLDQGETASFRASHGLVLSRKTRRSISA